MKADNNCTKQYKNSKHKKVKKLRQARTPTKAIRDKPQGQKAK